MCGKARFETGSHRVRALHIECHLPLGAAGEHRAELTGNACAAQVQLKNK